MKRKGRKWPKQPRMTELESTHKCNVLDSIIKSHDFQTKSASGRASIALRRPAKAAVCGLPVCSRGRSLLGTGHSEISERPIQGRSEISERPRSF